MYHAVHLDAVMEVDHLGEIHPSEIQSYSRNRLPFALSSDNSNGEADSFIEAFAFA